MSLHMQHYYKGYGYKRKITINVSILSDDMRTPCRTDSPTPLRNVTPSLHVWTPSGNSTYLKTSPILNQLCVLHQTKVYLQLNQIWDPRLTPPQRQLGGSEKKQPVANRGSSSHSTLLTAGCECLYNNGWLLWLWEDPTEKEFRESLFSAAVWSFREKVNLQSVQTF